MSTFSIGDDDFLLDGQPFRILSGALHYFRVHPDAWTDRIAMAKHLGLNTIETYVPWNAHSPRPGTFDTTGMLDLGRFLDTVAAHGLHAIVRPGPYICAEWSGGGLPSWLLASGATVRDKNPTYMDAVAEYYRHVGAIVAPRQIDRGGPVILVQVENEYGAYGDDQDYLRALVAITREVGITVPLTTVDQPEPHMLVGGSLPELHKTGSFGSRSRERLATLREHQPTGPLMCSEFWDGWFDSWGRHHHTTSAADSARELDELLAAGASVNLYMLCGGTNFGFTNGANHKGSYVPIVTSYDYDAPLDEAGRPTDKYWAFRKVLAKYTELPPADREPRREAPSFEGELTRAVPLLDVLDRLGNASRYDRLPTLDELSLDHTFVVYCTVDVVGPGVLELGEVRDRAQVFLDGTPIATLNRDHGERRVVLPTAGRVMLLVEDLGRVNYGVHLGEAKGLVGPARVDGAPVTSWEVRPLDLEPATLASLVSGGVEPHAPVLAGPCLAGATFGVDDDGADLFLDTTGWGKGAVWINGFCLGRFWSRGPQRTLYVPAAVLRPGDNELVVLMLDAGAASFRFVGDLDLGPTEE